MIEKGKYAVSLRSVPNSILPIGGYENEKKCPPKHPGEILLEEFLVLLHLSQNKIWPQI